MAGEQERRLRALIAGNKLDQAIDDELDQWLNAQTRLHEVGAALIDVSTPVSENFGADTVKGALDAFKAVGEKVKARADDIQQVHDALKHAVSVTRHAQTAVTEMDGDQRDKPVFPPSKPGDTEDDDMHNLKVYSGQMNLYNSWSTARETTSQQHADKVETAWKDAIAVMEKIPDDQQPGGGPGGAGGGGGTTNPSTPGGTTPFVPTATPHVTPTFTPTTWEPTHHTTPTPTHTETPTPVPTPVPTHHTVLDPVTPVVHDPAVPHHPGHVPVGGGLDPYPGGTPYGPTGPVPSGEVAPTPAVAPGSLSGYAVGGVAGAGILGGLGAGLRAAGVAGASGGLRSGGVLGASGRTAGSARGTLGTAGGRGSMAGGAASGGTGRGGSRGSAGRRGAGGAGGAGSAGGKGKDKKKGKPAKVELFDEDRDWIDDEGASSGVID